MLINLLLDGYTSVQVGDQRESGVVFLEVAQRTGVQRQQISGILEQFNRPLLQPTSFVRKTLRLRTNSNVKTRASCLKSGPPNSWL